MVPAILILTFAWTLKSMTDSLGSTVFVENIMNNAGELTHLFPAIVFVLAVDISFATGTSWGDLRNTYTDNTCGIPDDIVSRDIMHERRNGRSGLRRPLLTDL